MEDKDKELEKPAVSAENKKKIIELTPEMEISPELAGTIYDLTETVGSPLPASPPDEHPAEPLVEVPPFVSRHQGIPRTETLPEIENEVDAALETAEPWRRSDIDLNDDSEPSAVDDQTDDAEQTADNLLNNPSPESRAEEIAYEPPADETVGRTDRVEQPEPVFPTPGDDREGRFADASESPPNPTVAHEAAPDDDQVDDDDVIQLIDIFNRSRESDATETQSLTPEPGAETMPGGGPLMADKQDRRAGAGLSAVEAAGPFEEDAETPVDRYIRATYEHDMERMITAVIDKTVEREIAVLMRTYLEENGAPE
jgi:hypothetical protein